MVETRAQDGGDTCVSVSERVHVCVYLMCVYARKHAGKHACGNCDVFLSFNLLSYHGVFYNL